MERDKRTYKQVTANMTKKEKLSYIWSYYKFHITAAVIAIVVIINIASSILNRKDCVLEIKLAGSGMDTESLIKLQENAEAQLVKNKKRQEMSFSFIADQGANGTSIRGNQQLVLPISAGELDLVVLPKGGFEAVAAQGALVDLQSLTGLSGNSSNDLKFLNFKNEESGGLEKAYGIDMNCFPISKQFNFAESNMVIGVLDNSKNKEMAVEFIKWLIKQKSL